MKLYTGTGDDGSTSLFSGERVGKDDIRVEAYGTIDELNSVIALLHSLCHESILLDVQRTMFSIGAHLASSCRKPLSIDTTSLEESIDHLQSGGHLLKGFVLPAGSTRSTVAQLARTTCRRAERRVVAMSRIYPVAPDVLAYLNRLSDYLFALARNLNFIDKVEEKLL